MVRGITKMSFWTKTDKGYCVEASTLTGNNKHQMQYDDCPCEKYKFKTAQPHRDRENEITHWTVITPCCGELTIFND